LLLLLLVALLDVISTKGILVWHGLMVAGWKLERSSSHE
jgi:hypothetical protein